MFFSSRKQFFIDRRRDDHNTTKKKKEERRKGREEESTYTYDCITATKVSITIIIIVSVLKYLKKWLFEIENSYHRFSTTDFSYKCK